MKFKRLAHVCLHVKDLGKTLEFYHRLGLEDCFKFVRKGKDYGIYLKTGGDTFIEIFEEPEKNAGQPGGIAHFCLETEDLDGLIKHLAEQGIEHTPKELGGDHTWQIWLKDPDGHSFEVHQYTDKSLQHHGGSMEATW